MEFAKLLESTRLRRGLSMEAAAEQVGVHYSAWRQWEKGAGRPSAEHLGKVALWLGVPVERLLRAMGAISDTEEAELLRLAHDA